MMDIEKKHQNRIFLHEQLGVIFVLLLVSLYIPIKRSKLAQYLNKHVLFTQLTLTTMNKTIILTLLAAILLAGGCQRRTVTRVDTDQAIDLSGRWNDTDSRMVAEEMINDVLNRPWLNRFEEQHNERPVVIVGDVLNRTHEHIDAETFIRNMEREFINSGMVRVVQDAEFREQLREERADQHEFADPETIAAWRKEVGADFMLTGTINSIVDEYGRDRVVFYQVNLELADMETNEKVWIGEKQIRKTIQN